MNLRSNNCRLSVEDFEVGEKVTYHCFNKKQKGIVKSESDEEHVFVVYNCGGDWGNYKFFTAARTNINDLTLGWEDEKK